MSCLGYYASHLRNFTSNMGKGRDPLGVKGLKTISLNAFTPRSDFIDFTLSNARRFYLSKGDPLGEKGFKQA